MVPFLADRWERWNKDDGRERRKKKAAALLFGSVCGVTAIGTSRSRHSGISDGSKWMDEQPIAGEGTVIGPRASSTAIEHALPGR